MPVRSFPIGQITTMVRIDRSKRSKAPYPLKLPAGRFRVLRAPGATFLNREHAGDAPGSIQYVGLHREAGTLAGGNFFNYFFLILHRRGSFDVGRPGASVDTGLHLTQTPFEGAKRQHYIENSCCADHSVGKRGPFRDFSY